MIYIRSTEKGTSLEVVGSPAELVSQTIDIIARVVGMAAPLAAMRHNKSVKAAQHDILSHLHYHAMEQLRVQLLMDGEEPAPEAPEPTHSPRRRRRRSGGGLPVS